MKIGSLSFIFIAAILCLFISLNQSYSKEDLKKSECKIQTSAFTLECKDKIETKLSNTEGIFESSLNLGNKILTVKYDKEKIAPDMIAYIISELGYNAEVITQSSTDSTTTEKEDENKEKPKLN